MTEQIPLIESGKSQFITAKERYGTWPTTVWESNPKDSFTKSLKKEIGDAGQNRKSSFEKDDPTSLSTYRGKLTASIFSPQIAAYALNFYAPSEGGLIADPFAGGGTRAIMSAALGHNYIGTELREEEQQDVNRRVSNLGYEAQAFVVHDDGRNLDRHVKNADMILTCPPYWNLEKYDGGDKDLSSCDTYDGFVDAIQEVAEACLRSIKPGGIAVWVVGLHRDRKGYLLPLNHDVAAAHRRAGWILKEEVVIRRVNDGSITRVGQFERGRRHLIRQHEYALVLVAP